jgi:hypothetical protein
MNTITSPLIIAFPVKKLSELLEKSFAASSQFKRAQNRGDVILRKDEIMAEVANGWSLRTIWKALKDAGELTCAYSTFLNHVHRLQKNEPPAQPKTDAITPKKRKEFVWDATPRSKEELI